MSLFDNPRYEKFFNPLACSNRRVYYECITKLITESEDIPVLYENDAKDILSLYFRNCSYAVDEDGGSDDGINCRKTEAENAATVIRYFRKCGWLSEKEIGRNGDNIATVSPQCRKMIDAMERIFGDSDKSALTNRIFNIYEILVSAFTKDSGRTHRPYLNILIPMLDNISELKNELLALKDNIRIIMQAVIKMTETQQLGEFLVKDKVMEKFFNDYFFIKRNGIIPGYIEEIEKMLRRLPKTPVYSMMISDYESAKRVSHDDARGFVDEMIAEVQAFISYGYVRDIDFIDRKINSYYGLYATRIRMVLGGGVNMQSYLNSLLVSMKDLSRDEREAFLESAVGCLRVGGYRYVSKKSFQKRKRTAGISCRGIIECCTLTEEEKKAVISELAKGKKDKYSAAYVAEYIDRLADSDGVVNLSADMIKRKEDAMMFIAGMVYAPSDTFQYAAELLDGEIDTPVGRMSRIRFTSKENHNDWN